MQGRNLQPTGDAGPRRQDDRATTGSPVQGPLERDFALLERIADIEAVGEAGIGVSALAELVGREKSQVSRALGRLATAGLVERIAPSRRYRLGPRLFALAARAADGRLLVAAGEPMQALSAAVGETVHLVALAGAEIVTLRTESPHGYRATGWIGRRVPAHHTSAGRVLLGDATRAEIERRFAGASFEPARPTARVKSLDDLVATIDAAGVLGYATVDEEFEPGLAGASAPIRDFRGAIVAALNVSAPAERLRPRLDEVGEQTRGAAGRISVLLGWSASGLRAEGPTGPC